MRDVLDGTLDAAAVRRWCQLSLDGLAAAREEIDALNVYPVPDADTGTNLWSTMEAATAAASAAEVRADDVAGVLHAAARGALLGARGNSGVILSQLLRGAAEGLAADGRVPAAGPPGPRHLAAALARSAEQGYAAVAEPVEGTMLTVARAAADAGVQRARGAGATLAGVARAAARAGRVALARTPQQLDVLARAGVVDAGGRGLTVLLEAVDTLVSGRRPPVRARGLGPPALPFSAGPGLDLRPGGPAYEVMYLLEADDARVPALRTALVGLGDSVLVVGGDRLWHVHAHVHDVGAALEAGMRAGRPYRVRVVHFADQLGARPHRRGPANRAVVAVAAGSGIAEVLSGAGAFVVPREPGRHPSTAELLAAIHRTGALEVVVLPNDREGITVAEAAAERARDEGVRVAVLPTRAQVQGLAALAVHEASRSFDDDVVAMTTAAGHTRHGAVTVAARDAVTAAGRCRAGDALGLVDGDLAIVGKELAATAVEVVDRLLAGGGELVTLVSGGGAADPALSAAVARHVRSTRPEVETVVYGGGPPQYPLLIGVE